MHTQCACGLGYGSGNDLVLHVKQAHNKKVGNKTVYFCPLDNCPQKPVSDIAWLLDHFAATHTQEQVVIMCKYCGQQNPTYRAAQKHRRSHTMVY